MRYNWYLLLTITGYESKAKENLEAKIEAQGYSHLIRRVVVPEETIIDASAKSSEKHVVSLAAKLHFKNGDDVEKGAFLAEEPSYKIRHDGTVIDLVTARRIVVETADRKFSKTFVIPESSKLVPGLKIGTMVYQGTALSKDNEYISDLDGKIVLNEKVKKIVIRTYSGEEDTYVVPYDVFNKTSVKKGTELKSGTLLAEGKKYYAKNTGKVSIVEFPTRREIIIQKTIKKKIFPGYIFVEMLMNDDTWQFVRSTPFIIDFVSSGGRPNPLKPEEARYIMKLAGIEKEKTEVQKEEKQVAPKIQLDISIGESVKIITGPFEGFVGTVKEIDEEKQELKVMVTIFGRETPVNVHVSEVEKLS